MTIKEKEKNQKTELLNKAKESETFKFFLNHFPDAELIDIQTQKEKNDND